ncbi:nucleoside hydrolase-like domain-containing protein [Roseateles sp. DC23W]|uniref:Nucleoside hydrolase-like domain-containing protein n=1 Tax=Pelomonas dachongensis TaxID=3299029 RepID=A0ABW7ETL4_9BURK
MKHKPLALSLLAAALGSCCITAAAAPAPPDRPRVIVTTDGEVDDECSLVRFLMYANEWDVEGIVTTSSQYHWQGHKWAGDDWAQPILKAYAQVQPNLLKHDPRYPSAEYLQARTVLGNVKAEGEMAERTPGSELIARVLLDDSDPRPVWVQAWGGTNTLARALKTIEEEHPEKMAAVAARLRLFLIWEQDDTYQRYIRPRWGHYQIPTIISDQFWALAYEWKRIQPAENLPYLKADWMKTHILNGHGPLAALYKAHVPGSYGLLGDTDFEPGEFRSEGDSPAFLHLIDTGLRNLESPDWGGWGGRYVRVRDNTWLDPVPVAGYVYPEGRWYTGNAWGRSSLRKGSATTEAQRSAYFKPIWRWTQALQNDFAARADWNVLPYAQANHPPQVRVAQADIRARPGQTVRLSTQGSTDPDGHRLQTLWWHDDDAGSYRGPVRIANAGRERASFTVPKDAPQGSSIHVVAEVTDDGTPRLTRYRRVVIRVE